MESDTTTLSFTPLTGAFDEKPYSYLLCIDEFVFLLDCGWSEDFKKEDIKPVVDAVNDNKINAVLISHSSIEHCGALPYLVKKGLNAPIYATSPCKEFGRHNVYESYINMQKERNFSEFNVKDIIDAFAMINEMTFQQKEKINNIYITPYNVGLTMGGAAWFITKGDTQIIYSVGIGSNNKHTSLVFDTLKIDTWIQDIRPNLWIIDARGSVEEVENNVKMFEDNMKRYLHRNKNMSFLVPTDAGSIAVEVMVTLFNTISNFGLDRCPIYFHCNKANSIIDFLKNNYQFLKEDFHNKYKAFFEDFERFRAVDKEEELENILEKADPPYFVVTTDPHISHGPSLKHFLQDKDRRVVIFTHDIKNPGTIHEFLYTENEEEEFKFYKRVPLQGEELEKHILKQRERFDFSNDEALNKDEEQTIQQEILPSLAKKHLFKFRGEQRYQTCDYGVAINSKEKYARGTSELKSLSIKKGESLNTFSEFELGVPCKASIETKVLQRRDYITMEVPQCRASIDNVANLVSYFLDKNSNLQDIVIIGASKNNTEKLQKLILSKHTHTHTPKPGERINFQRNSSSWKISLSQALMSNLNFQQIYNKEVAFIDAVLTAEKNKNLMTALPSQQHSGHLTTYFGEGVEFNDVKDKLESLNIACSQKGTMLVCGRGKVKVHWEDKKITIDGSLCPDLIVVRSAIEELVKMV